MATNGNITVAVQADVLPMLRAQRDALRDLAAAYTAASAELTERIRTMEAKQGDPS